MDVSSTPTSTFAWCLKQSVITGMFILQVFGFQSFSGMWVWVCFAFSLLDLKANGKDKLGVHCVIRVDM